jgi:1-phosphofructokinase family hexose kinase
VVLILGQNLAWQKVYALSSLERGGVNRIDQVYAFGSSKGPNVARALAGLGGDGQVICYAGGATGRLAETSLRAEGIRCTPVKIAAETRVCTTFTERDGTSTEAIEPSPKVTAAERDEMRRRCLARLRAARLLVISGTAVSGESEDCYSVLVREARARGVVTLLDSASPEARLALAEGPEILKINARELGEIAQQPVEELAERVSACRGLAARFGVRWFMVSHGPAGIEAFDGTTLLHAAPPPVKVINVIGSGDAAAAGAAWAVHEMLDAQGREAVFSSSVCLREALASAAAAGTANCLNPINGKVIREDWVAVRKNTRVSELQAP